MPLVSVIIPTHNRCKVILETLESVFAQSFTDYEVIVVNDGSTDDTASVLEPLAAQGKIRYIEQKSQGVSAARNTGFAIARGKYIGFLDDDDLYIDSKLETQVEFMEKNPGIEIVFGGHEFFGSSERVVNPPARYWSFRDILAFNPLGVGSELTRKSALDELSRSAGGSRGLFDATIHGGEDYDLWLSLAYRCDLYCDGRVAFRRRAHDANSSSNVEMMLDHCAVVARRHLGILSKKDRTACRIISTRFLYELCGQKLYFLGLRDIRRGRIAAGFKKLRALRPYFSFASGDPALCVRVAVEMGRDAVDWFGSSFHRALRPEDRG